jgi:hypothetical protein
MTRHFPYPPCNTATVAAEFYAIVSLNALSAACRATSSSGVVNGTVVLRS